MTPATTTFTTSSSSSSSSGENFSMPPPPLPASSSASSAVDDDDDDSLFCILSNILFISGGIVYITASSWDYSLYAYADSPNDVDNISTILTTHYFTYLLYEAIWILGPFMYFLNSIVDVKWALRSKRRTDRKQRDPSSSNSSSLATEDDNKEKKSNIVKEIIRHIRKNVGSRRTLGAASTFGVGAFCGLVGALLSTRAAANMTTTNNNVLRADTLYAQADVASSASVHIYLLSAICVLWKTTKAWKLAVKALFSNNNNTKWYNNPSSLFTLGDILFGIAAINDTISTDSTLDDEYVLYSMPIFSAILWTLDALLYTRGDICVFRLEATAAATAAAAGVDSSLSSLGNNNNNDVELSSPAPPVVVVVDPENEIV